MERNAMAYRGRNNTTGLKPQLDLQGDKMILPFPLKRAEVLIVNQDASAAALLPSPDVRRLVELLRSLTVRERTTILAQAIREGAMTRLGADQVVFALAWTATAAQRQRHLGEVTAVRDAARSGTLAS